MRVPIPLAIVEGGPARHLNGEFGSGWAGVLRHVCLYAATTGEMELVLQFDCTLDMNREGVTQERSAGLVVLEGTKRPFAGDATKESNRGCCKRLIARIDRRHKNFTTSSHSPCDVRTKVGATSSAGGGRVVESVD